MSGSLIEIAKLAMRCSFVETVREYLSTRCAFLHPKKSPYSTDPPAVCVIAQNTAWGGTEQHTRDLVKRLLAHGLHVKYIMGAEHIGDPELASLQSYACEYIRVPLNVEDVAGRKAWIRVLRQMKSHAVILPCPRVEFGSFAFLGALRRSFRKVVYIEQLSPTPLSEDFQQPGWCDLLRRRGRRNWIEYLRRRYRMRCADHIVAVSEQVSHGLTDWWFADKNKVVTVCNGVSDRWEPNTAATRDKARSAFNIPTDALVFGMVTRLHEVKGVDIALRAFAQTHFDRDAVLAIAGEGPQEDALRNTAQELGIADHVRWLGFQERPNRVYQMIDAILLPSRAEGLPLVLLEAMACGVIPVTSNVDGMPEVIEDASLGWVTPVEDVAQLSNAMRGVASLDANERGAFGARVRRHVRQRFDLQANLDQLLHTVGVLDDVSWNRTYLFSKLRDMCDAWLDYFKMRAIMYQMREWPRRSRNDLASKADGKPTVCVLESSNGWGGAENHTYLLIEHLLKHRYAIEYVAGKGSAPVPPQGVEVIQAPVGVLEDGPHVETDWMSTFSQLKSRVVVFPALDVEFGRSIGLIKAMRYHFDRIIYIEHTLPPAMPHRTPKRYLCGLIPSAELGQRKEKLRRKMRMCCPSHVIAVSDSVRQHFIDTWYCPPKKIETVRNGVDCEKFNVTDARRREARQVFGLSDSSIVFGMMSRLNPEKGVDLAVRAFAAYRERDPNRDAYLIVGGSGPEAEALQRLGEELGVADRIRWVGFVKDTVKLFALMDVVLVTSRVEGLPLALLEGMAAGLIPIVFRIGGMPEVIADPSLGWVIEPEDITGVAEAMREASRLTQDEITAYRERVRRCMREKFDLHNSNGRIAEIIEHG